MGFLGGLFGTRDSPFPAWLERRHPVLARWRENAPYLAFRARRRDHSYPLLQRLGNLRPFWQVLWLLIAALMLPAGIIAVFYLGIWGLCIPIAILGGAAIFPRVLKGRRLCTVPWRLADLYLQPDVYHQAILDFYLTTNNGSDIAEGVYLEGLEEDLKMLEVAVITSVIAVLLICLPVSGSISFWGGMVAVSLIAALLSSFLTLVDTKVICADYSPLHAVRGHWNRAGGLENSMGFVVHCVIIVVILLFFWVIAGVIQILLVHFLPLRASTLIEDVRFAIAAMLWAWTGVMYMNRSHTLRGRGRLPGLGNARAEYLKFIQMRYDDEAGFL